MTKAKKLKIPSLDQEILTQNKLVLEKVLAIKTSTHTYKVKSQTTNKFLLLKIAQNKKANLPLQNQYLWLKSIEPQIPQKASFLLPKPIEIGKYNNNTWFLSGFIKGRQFGLLEEVITKLQADNPQKYFEKIANMLIWLNKLESKGLRGIDLGFGSKIKYTKLDLLQEAISVSRNTSYFLSDLLKIISSNYKALKKSTNHCDVTPINIIITSKDKVALIDSDLANLLHFKYYDVAEFHNRLFTRVCEPKLAKQFLSTFVSKLKSNQRSKFLTSFLCLSALRAIANYGEIETLPEKFQSKREKYARLFAKEVSLHKIFDY